MVQTTLPLIQIRMLGTCSITVQDYSLRATDSHSKKLWILFCYMALYRSREIHLTAKEYRLLWLLVVNKGQVLTYQQIYEKVWGDISSGGESAAIGYHICNLRDKLYAAFPDAPFEIRCVREVGYCFEVHSMQST